MPMRIYTITCHNVYNYGATLQAYALQHYLSEIGHDVTIIDYRPDYLDWHYHLSWWIPKSSKHYSKLSKSFIKRGLYVLFRFFNDMKSYPRAWAFNKFNKQYLRLSCKCKTIEAIKKITNDADCLITGSDQVWNSLTLPNGYDSAFYLGFAQNGATKLSYAASFGGSSIDIEAIPFIKEHLSKFDSISVREQSGVNILHSMNLDGTVVCDPVFLLSKEDWLSAFNYCAPNEDKYILIYNLGHDSKAILRDAIELKKRTGIRVVSLLTNVSIDTDEELRAESPDRFISLINNAQIVLTNSFHATSFAILFNKKFYVYTGNNGKTNTRIFDLLRLCCIEDRLNPPSVSFDENIDYAKVNKRMKEYIDFSKRWLIKAIGANE